MSMSRSRSGDASSGHSRSSSTSSSKSGDTFADWWNDIWQADGDGKGLGDWWADPKNRSAVSEGFAETNQAIGTVALEVFGMGSLADSINTVVDMGQVEVNRNQIRDWYGADFLALIDALCAKIKASGWQILSSVVLALDGMSEPFDLPITRGQGKGRKSLTLRFAVPVGQSFWREVSWWVYAVAPELWLLDGAPAVPNGYKSVAQSIYQGSGGSSLGGSISSSVSSSSSSGGSSGSSSYQVSSSQLE